MFVPETLTHLFHTPVYARLDAAQRAKYNGLYALRINEQFARFEQLFILRLVPRLERQRAMRADPALLAEIRGVLRDEHRHSLMFNRFNRAMRPDLYADGPVRFTRLSAVETGLFKGLLASPGLLPALLWLLLAMEELTTAISAELVTHPDAAGLDPDYIALHRSHYRDEQRHVGIDRRLVGRLLENLPDATQRFNAWLFGRIFRSILAPRRSTIAVVRQFAREEPVLAPYAHDMVRAITRLEPAQAFPAGLVRPDRLPVLYAMAERYPAYRACLPHPAGP